MAIASELPSHPPYKITFPLHLMLYNLYSWNKVVQEPNKLSVIISQPEAWKET